MGKQNKTTCERQHPVRSRVTHRYPRSTLNTTRPRVPFNVGSNHDGIALVNAQRRRETKWEQSSGATELGEQVNEFFAWVKRWRGTIIYATSMIAISVGVECLVS